MARAPRKRRNEDTDEDGPSGPKIPGAQAKPIVVANPPKKPQRKRSKKAEAERRNDPVAKSEAITNYQGSGLNNGATMTAMKKAQRLKQLIEPLTPSLIQVCSDIAHDTKVHAAVRLDAATRLLDRLYGKPKEHVEVSSNDDAGSQDEVHKLLNNILESVGAPLLDAPSSANDQTGVGEGRNAQGE